MTTMLQAGTVHSKVPLDLQRALESSKKARATWEDITPLARNEWICWVDSAAQNKTKARRIKRAEEELSVGDRRPCFWIGCIHRTDKEISPSVRGILSRNKRKPKLYSTWKPSGRLLLLLGSFPSTPAALAKPSS